MPPDPACGRATEIEAVIIVDATNAFNLLNREATL